MQTKNPDRWGGAGRRKAYNLTRQFYASNAASTIDFTTIKARAYGSWSAILHALAPALGPALDRPGRHVPCPVHGGKDGFRVFRDVNRTGGGICNTCGSFPDGFALLAWINGWQPGEAVRVVARDLGLTDGPVTPSQPLPVPARPSQPPPNPTKARARLASIWRASLVLDHPDAEPARRYLVARGLQELIGRGDLPADLRLHLGLPYWHAGPGGKPIKLGEFPALVALVRDPAGAFCGVHRTYLQAGGGGKAALVDPATGEILPAKKLLAAAPGSTKGAAVRLYQAGPRLAVGEGLETCLAVRVALPDLPLWAAISAGGLAALALPDGVQEVIILADNDASGTGEKAAKSLARRVWQSGRVARIAMPQAAGTDYADVLTGRVSS